MKFILQLILALIVLGGISVLVVVQPIFPTPAANIAVRVTPSALEEHVKLLTQANPPRKGDANLDITAAYIVRQFERAKGKTGNISEQTFTIDNKTYRNISLMWGEGKRPRIVIGAHYDSFEGLPGADDNASGVAVLLEVAKLLTDRENKNDIELVAYSQEEPPYFGTENMGSYYHAKKLSDDKIDVILMISLEMLGYYSDTEGSQTYPVPGMNLIYPKKGDYVALVSNLPSMLKLRRAKQHMQSAINFPAYSLTAPGFVPGVMLSDQLWYWKFGMPAIMITDTAFYRNLSYHSEGDTMDRLDFNRMAKVGDGVFQITVAFDE